MKKNITNYFFILIFSSSYLMCFSQDLNYLQIGYLSHEIADSNRGSLDTLEFNATRNFRINSYKNKPDLIFYFNDSLLVSLSHGHYHVEGYLSIYKIGRDSITETIEKNDTIFYTVNEIYDSRREEENLEGVSTIDLGVGKYIEPTRKITFANPRDSSEIAVIIYPCINIPYNLKSNLFNGLPVKTELYFHGVKAIIGIKKFIEKAENFEKFNERIKNAIYVDPSEFLKILLDRN